MDGKDKRIASVLKSDMKPEWKHSHTEILGAGKSITHQRDGEYFFDEVECYPELDAAQRIQIGGFTGFGRGLVMDGVTQLTETTDPLYTGALVFPVMMTARARRNVLIAGGSDGAAPRECFGSRA